MLKILPCLDSDKMARSRRQELRISRQRATRLAQSAIEAATQGYYYCGAQRVDWQAQVQTACAAKISIPPQAPLPAPPQKNHGTITRIQVTNETTLGAAWRLVKQGQSPLALNFANGIRPGGGFLHGARAQEEVLCRCSALYQTLINDPMYAAHRQRPQPDATDWAIYSPHVPVFRTDAGQALPRPWLLSFITCAAPYAPAIGQPTAGDLLQRRIQRVLAIARAYGHTSLVLGAWGCGAFGNDPHRTARDFRHALENEFRGAFAEVVFAITDWSPERKFLGPFARVFAPPPDAGRNEHA